MAVSKAEGEGTAGGVGFSPAHPKRAETRSLPSGYVEDGDKPRTQLAAIFNNGSNA